MQISIRHSRPLHRNKDMQSHKIIVKDFHFEAGGHLDTVDVLYHTSDREYAKGDKVVWICHALTGNSDPQDWWPGLVGPGKFIDPDKYYVVCVNMLGSPYGTSSPASINPASGKPFYFDFPRVTVRDICKCNFAVMDYLGIERVDILMGPSIGGFQALEMSIMQPERVKNAIFMATLHRTSPYLTAYEEAQRMAMEADPTFREAASLKGGEAGLRAARAIALISYRSYEGYKLTQSETDPDTMFANKACTYERYQGKKLSDRFDAYSYWYLSYSLDSHNVGRGRGGCQAALSRITANCVAAGIDTDCLFPCSEVKGMSDMIPNCHFARMFSDFGHDGFLLENEQLEGIIAPLL